MDRLAGGFTLPGESGQEQLTLALAEKWGADVIRDSDGTELSAEILDAGYGIYSTICIIRDHNAWAKDHPDMLQQSFLMSEPVMATSDEVEIQPLAGYDEGQFRLNDGADALAYWQVFDRTTGAEVMDWRYEDGRVTVARCEAWHRYTVNFLAYRVWEEISMYNHVTNGWDKEHLVPVEPAYPECRAYLLRWMRDWCEAHPKITVVRFTSLFYNFVWIWGADGRRRNRFTDWASYDFTVSLPMLAAFEAAHGYRMTAEDFINKGALRATHRVPDERKRDWMDFVGGFSLALGRALIDIVHEYGKKAYVFYDDSWVGLEPYHPRFAEYGFDGLIKCVFSGFEVRLCAGVPAVTHEIRLHPYLFPVGLGGLPTFAPGGHPTADAQRYWMSVRRAMLRAKIDRIGLGGYLSLTLPYPDFGDYIQQVAGEFRQIRSLHELGAPAVLRPKVAVLTAWGSLRSWTLSGHFHETHMHELIHVIESLSGLPLDVSFLSFEDVCGGVPTGVDVIVNCGEMGTAWSGGDCWKCDAVVEALTKWVHGGGAMIGIGEPSAVDGYDTLLRMAHVLGVDVDHGQRACHGRWAFEVEPVPGLLPVGAEIMVRAAAFLTDGNARVLAADGDQIALSTHDFGTGKGVYLAHYRHDAPNARMLLNLILFAAGESLSQDYLAEDAEVDCAYYPAGQVLAVANRAAEAKTVRVAGPKGTVCVDVAGFGLAVHAV